MEGVPLHVLVERDGRGDEVWKDLCSVLDPFRLLSLKKVQNPPSLTMGRSISYVILVFNKIRDNVRNNME